MNHVYAQLATSPAFCLFVSHDVWHLQLYAVYPFQGSIPLDYQFICHPFASNHMVNAQNKF